MIAQVGAVPVEETLLPSAHKAAKRLRAKRLLQRAQDRWPNAQLIHRQIRNQKRGRTTSKQCHDGAQAVQ